MHIPYKIYPSLSDYIEVGRCRSRSDNHQYTLIVRTPVERPGERYYYYIKGKGDPQPDDKLHQITANNIAKNRPFLEDGSQIFAAFNSFDPKWKAYATNIASYEQLHIDFPRYRLMQDIVRDRENRRPKRSEELEPAIR